MNGSYSVLPGFDRPWVQSAPSGPAGAFALSVLVLFAVNNLTAAEFWGR